MVPRHGAESFRVLRGWIRRLASLYLNQNNVEIVAALHSDARDSVILADRDQVNYAASFATTMSAEC